MQTSDAVRLHAGEVGRGAQKQEKNRGDGPWRVFFLVDSFMLGGTETQAVELARRLDPARYRVTVGCLRSEGPLLERLAATHLPIVHVDMGGGGRFCFRNDCCPATRATAAAGGSKFFMLMTCGRTWWA